MIYFPGSFKPPHKGHLSIIKQLLKDYPQEKITIIISNKIRPLNPDFYQLKDKSPNELKLLMKKYNFEYTTKKDSIQKLTHYYIEKNEFISPQQSLLLMNYYINHSMNNKDKSRIKVIVSYLPSPIQTLMSKVKNGNYYVKSSKNSDNKRFNSIQKGVMIEYPSKYNLHSKNFRKNLYLKKSIKRFIPLKMDEKKILNIIYGNIKKK